ncbi:hypothetical protein GX48_03188 [Paracoccidioides brasiliensis]|nr:hypothetical protein GX48_03188 [Paracoccidioides brasiliensis]
MSCQNSHPAFRDMKMSLLNVIIVSVATPVMLLMKLGIESNCKPWFTVCFVPVVPLSTHKYKEVSCHICRFAQDLSKRPDVQSQAGGGGPPPPAPYQGHPGWGPQGPGAPVQAHQGYVYK